MAAEGATVILNGRSSKEALEERAARLKSEFGVECLSLLADASDPAAVSGCYKEIFKQFKRLDILVNNAGILEHALMGMIPAAMARTVLEVNTMGPLLHMQEAARLMGRHQSGSIINLTSIVGRVGMEGESVYAASKAGVIGMTLAAAKELAPKNIRVNAVAPGFIDTDMTRQLPPDKFAERLKSVKMNRIGTPEDIANVILFLASDSSSYVTGQVIGVDGGMLV
jgi:3-oxoacyl-[acyl-carrier protein] reductase